MAQDPKKEVGEMGKPSLKAKFEEAMQKKFDSDNKKKAPKEDRMSLMVKSVKQVDNTKGDKIYRMVKDVKEVKEPLKKKYSLMKSMNKLD